MLNILKKKLNKSNNNSFTSNDIKNPGILYEKRKTFLAKEYNNLIYYPFSSKEWLNTVYSFNKSYIKSVVSYDVNLNKLIKSYLNMFLTRIKNIYGSRHPSKSRFTVNKIYVSRAELNHTSSKVVIILYTFNKQKAYLEQFLRKLMYLKRSYPKIKRTEKSIVIRHNKRIIAKLKASVLFREILKRSKRKANKKHFNIFTNRLIFLLKDKISYLEKWNTAFFRFEKNILYYLALKLKRRRLYNIPSSTVEIVKKLFNFRNLFFYYVKSINFNKSKFNNLLLNLRNLGLVGLLYKIYGKKVEIKVVELKSLHLNSDIFSSAIALKLTNRQNKAIFVLKKAISQFVKIPDLHTLITSDDNCENMNKHNIIKTIKQQVVSGVRFEASGRLTKRLTAMRAVFKSNYVGSLKNVRSSYNNQPSTMLRGHVKSNTQYTLINSKTPNGSFGLKGWVSSH